MAKPQPSSTDSAHAAIDSALRTLEAEGGGIDALRAALSNGLGGTFVAAIDLIRGVEGRVIVTGMGKSGHVGTKIASTLASTGTPALFVHPAEASHGDLGMITKADVILALSWSGETAELKNLTDFSRRYRIGLIAMTANADSTLGRTADVVLALPQARELAEAEFENAGHALRAAARLDRTVQLRQVATGPELVLELLGLAPRAPDHEALAEDDHPRVQRGQQQHGDHGLHRQARLCHQGHNR